MIVRRLINRFLLLMSVLIELIELTSENQLLLKEIDILETLNDSLTYAHQSGAYDPTKTKVLQLSENPDLIEYAIRTDKLNGLREENEALLLKSGETVPRESLERIRKELEEAKAFVVQKEILEKRLVKVRISALHCCR